MDHYFELRERLRENVHQDVRGHFLCWAVLNVDVTVLNCLTNEMKLDVDVFCTGMIVVVCCKTERGLIVAK